MKEEKGRKPVITIGKDTRISSDMLENALVAGICSVGADVELLGVIPPRWVEPQLSLMFTPSGSRCVGLVCTSVGDRNVLEKMNECGYKLGGEQSGHTIFTDFSTTGDGQLTALQFLDVLSRSGKKASELASVCPQYPQVLLNVPVSHERGVKDAIMASDALSAAIAEEEGKLSGEGRVLVRPSGTEALIRVMVEAKTEQIALLAAENLVNVIKML